MPLQAVNIREILSVEDLISAISSRSLLVLDLGCKRLAVHTRPEPQSAASFAVLKASTTSGTVHNGCITLRKDTVLLLTGEGVDFSGTSFSGTVPFTCSRLWLAQLPNCQCLELHCSDMMTPELFTKWGVVPLTDDGAC